MTRLNARLRALCGLLSLIAAREALAADGACPAATVVASTALEQRFPLLPARVRDQVSLSRDDSEVCAQIELDLHEESSIQLQVALPDGRRTARVAAGQEDVIPMLRALLVVPAGPSSAATSPSKATARRAGPSPEPTVVRAGGSEPGDGLAASPGRPSGDVGVELSLLTGSRIGDGQASIALGAMSFLDLGGWLVGFQARVDRYYLLLEDDPDSAQLEDDPDMALELAALFGKRLHYAGLALDVVAGPGFAIKGAVSDSEVVAVNMPPPEPPPASPERSSGAVPRLLAGARLGFSPRAVFRTFVALDGTYGATAVAWAGQGSPRLPEWTVGVSLGATVGTR